MGYYIWEKWGGFFLLLLDPRLSAHTRIWWWWLDRSATTVAWGGGGQLGAATIIGLDKSCRRMTVQPPLWRLLVSYHNGATAPLPTDILEV